MKQKNKFGFERKDLSFGPIGTVCHDDGSISIMCVYSGRRCLFMTGSFCTHNTPHKKIDDVNETPDFCEFKADTIREIEEIQLKYNRQKTREQ